MNIFDPHITGSLSVSASAHIEGDLTVLGTIRGDAQITGEVDNAISASHAASYLLTSSFEGVSGSFAITGSNNFKGDQTISGSLLPEGTLVHDIGSESQRWNDIYLAGSTIDIGGTKISKNDDGDVQFHDSGNTLKKIIASEIQIGHGNNRKTLKVSNGRFKLTGLEDVEEGLANLSGSFTGSFVGDGSQLTNVPASGVTGLSLDSISSGSNSLTMGETVLVSNVSILPNITDTIDLGSPTKQWRDLFLSSGSLYINGQQVLSTTGDELRITTDTGESIKIIETSTDTITLQTEDGDITLTASGNGNIELDAPIQIGAGNKILSSDGNEIQFGNGLSVTGSVVLTGTVDGVDIAGLNTTFNSFTSSTNGAINVESLRINSLEGFTASIDDTYASDTDVTTLRTDLNTYTSSNDTTNTNQDDRLDSLETKTGSLDTTNTTQNGRLDSVENFTSSVDGQVRSDFNTYTASNDSNISTLNTHKTTVEGGLEFTGSNVTIKGNLLVKGTETRVNSTTVDLDDNIISLNGTGASDAGIEVRDVTSPGILSGSLLWDGVTNYWKGGTKGNEERLLDSSDLTTLDGRLDSIETTTSSFDGRLDSLEITTGSLKSQVSSLEGFTASIDDTYATDADVTTLRTDLNTYTSSNDTNITTLDGRLDSLETESGSVKGRLEHIEIATGSLSIDITTLDGRLDSVETKTGSLSSDISTLDGRVDTIESQTGSYQDGYDYSQVGHLPLSGGTITGNVTLENLRTSNSGKLYLWNDHNANYLDYRLWVASSSAGMTIKNTSAGGGIILQTNSTTALTIDSSQNATFVGTLSASGYNDGNWNTAYGWGDHSTEGYIKSFTNTNEFVSGVTFNSTNGVLTFTRNNGGDTFTVDIDGRYSLLNHVHTFASLTSKPTTLSGYGITDAATSTQGSNADTAFGWGNHASVGYITSFTNTNEFVSGATFNSTNGVITFTRNNGGDTFTVDIDGRYLTSIPNSLISTPQLISGTSGVYFYNHFSGNQPTDAPSGGRGAGVQFGGSAYSAGLHVGGGLYFRSANGEDISVASWVRAWSDSDFTSTNISNWNTAYGWGNHASVGYLTAHPTVTASASSNNGGRTYIQDIFLDSFGHITGITTATETVVDTNNFVTGHTWNSTTGVLTTTLNDGSTTNVNLVNTLSDVTVTGGTYASGTQILTLTKNDGSTVDVSGFAIDTDVNWYTTGSTFNSTNGVITFTRSDGGTYTVDTDGRYLTSYTETDTLDSVTDRGATTTNGITVGELTTTRISTATDSNLYLYPTGNGQLYLGDSGNGMNMYHYSQQNNGKYTTFTHNGNYYRISPTATSGLEITSNTKITGTLTASGYNDSNWNTAYGWGDHSGVYLPIGGKAADSELLDGIDSTDVLHGNANGTNDSVTTDLDGLDKTGFYTSSAFVTKPSSVSNWMYVNHIKLYNSNTNYQKQIGYDTYDDRMWLRTKDNGTWTSWKSVWNSGDFANNSSNWNTAYGWGDHSTEGYIKSFTNTNEFTTGATFNNGNGIVTFTRNNGGDTFTVDLDGRYLQFDINGAATDVNDVTRTIFSVNNTNGTTTNRNANYTTVYTLGGGANALQLGTNPDYDESGLWVRQYNQNAASPQGTGWQNWTELWTTEHFSANDRNNWNTAYGWGNHASVGYLTTFSESDTLHTVLGRNNVSTRSMTIGSTLNVTADGGSNYTASRIYLNSHNDARGLGVFMSGVGSTWYAGTPYGNHAGSYIISRKGTVSDEATANPTHALFTLTNTGNLSVDGTLTASGYNDGNWNTAYGWGDHSTEGYLTSSSTQSKYLRSDTDDTTTGALTIGEGTNQARLIIKKADNDVSDHIALYNGTTRIGEIGAQDDTWLRINQSTNKNIYTPRYIRADSGFFVNDTSKGINGSGNFIGGTITGASDANVANWDTAYGWGNHASAGYLTSFTETNSFLGDGGDASTHPGTGRLIFTGQVSAGSGVLGMPTVDNSNAFLNINRHSGEYNSQLGFSSNGHIYYRKFSAAAINGTQPWLQVYHSGVFTNNSSNWNTAYGWGNHASAGYISSFTDTNEFVTGATFNGSNGIVTFTRNNGGDTFTLNLASTLTDVTVTGGTYTSGTQTLRLTKSDGNTIDVSGFAIDTDTNTNNYTTGATFNTGNGIITGTLNGGGTWTVDIDGKYSELSHNHDDRYFQDNKGSISLTGSNPFDDSKTETRVTGSGSYVINYTGASAHLFSSNVGGSASMFQIGAHYNGSDFYMRTRTDSSTWQTWKQLWHSGDFSSTDISQWNTAYGWGDHASAGYITSPNGGNADTLDSLDSTQFLRSDVSDTHTATLTVNGQFIFNSSLNSSYREGIRLNVSTTGWGAAVIGGQRNSISGITDGWWVARNPSKDFVISYGTSANSGGLYLPYNSSALEYKNNRIWNESDFANNSGNWNTAYGWGNHTGGGYATLSGSNSFTNSYNEFGNGTGSVSNDGSWNARVNIAGTQHARVDVKSVSDGIITTMFSHIGHAAGKVGTYSNHPLKLVINGIDKATLDSGGGFTLVGGLTSTTVNTGQGATEVHLMNQNVRTTDSPTFSTLNATSLVATSTVSGSTVLDIQGTQGQLFSITDDLTGDLFSVSDSSGVPIFNVNANGTVSIDTLGLLTVGGSITGTSFVKSGGTSSEFLKADGSVDSTTYLSSLPSHTHTFASLTSKPTTLSGYGITDAASSTHTHTFASLTSKPTTLSGYGITDAATSAQGTNADTAFGWGNHGLSAQDKTDIGNLSGTNTGDQDLSGYASNTNVSNWDTAFGWGDHGLSAQDKTDIGNLSGTNTGDQDLSSYASNTNVSNWDTAYGWGDHSLAGYTSNTGTLTDSNDRNYITDSRGAARAPSYYNDRYAQWDFQNVSDTGVGGDGWHALLTVSKWASWDASHRQEQLIFSGDHLWRRTATSDSAWGTNKKIWDSGNLTNNSSDWDTAYGWGDHGLSAQDKTDIGNLSGTNTGDQTNISGNAATATYATTAGSADLIDGQAFKNTTSNSPQNADTIASNGISYYTSGVTNFSGNSTDGALYSQAYSSTWQHQIAGDFRSGQIAVRGKNSGTWQSWKKVALVNSTTFSSVLGVAFTHGLGTKNLVVQVYDTNDNLFFPSDINVTDTEVNIDFAKPRSGRVVVTG